MNEAARGIDLSGKVAIVTGASRGIGKAIALSLARHGADVALVARSAEALDLVRDQTRQLGRRAESYAVDVASFEAAQATASLVKDKFGAIDILVNNAGVTRDQILPRLSPEDWRLVLSVNLDACFYWMKAVIRFMMKARSGRIVNVSSVVGLTGNAGQANYAASKAGILALTKSVAKEFGSRGILVNAIAPGYVETDMTRDLPEAVKTKMLQEIPVGRFGTGDEIARTVVFLASPYADYVQGHVLRVDGGLVMHG